MPRSSRASSRKERRKRKGGVSCRLAEGDNGRGKKNIEKSVPLSLPRASCGSFAAGSRSKVVSCASGGGSSSLTLVKGAHTRGAATEALWRFFVVPRRRRALILCLAVSFVIVYDRFSGGKADPARGSTTYFARIGQAVSQYELGGFPLPERDIGLSGSGSTAGCTTPPAILVIPSPSQDRLWIPTRVRPSRTSPPLVLHGCALSLPLEFIDDDYCDCPDDGSDEPHTSACGKSMFSCGVECSTERLIPAGWVYAPLAFFVLFSHQGSPLIEMMAYATVVMGATNPDSGVRSGVAKPCLLFLLLLSSCAYFQHPFSSRFAKVLICFSSV